MQTGFNTNIRYRGVLFHVQSEDSGRAHPHIITHLYYGGTILASEKSGYGDHLDAPNVEEVVKTLMENQHKAVLKRLVAADFDDVIRSRMGDDFLDANARTASAAPASAERPAAPASEPRVQPASPSRADAAITAPLDGHETLPEVVAEPEASGADVPVAELEVEAEPGSDDGRAFGEGIVSEKPLDEVILGYLVENARKRKRQRQ